MQHTKEVVEWLSFSLEKNSVSGWNPYSFSFLLLLLNNSHMEREQATEWLSFKSYWSHTLFTLVSCQRRANHVWVEVSPSGTQKHYLKKKWEWVSECMNGHSSSSHSLEQSWATGRISAVTVLYMHAPSIAHTCWEDQGDGRGGRMQMESVGWASGQDMGFTPCWLLDSRAGQWIVFSSCGGCLIHISCFSCFSWKGEKWEGGGVIPTTDVTMAMALGQNLSPAGTRLQNLSGPCQNVKTNCCTRAWCCMVNSTVPPQNMCPPFRVYSFIALFWQILSGCFVVVWLLVFLFLFLCLLLLLLFPLFKGEL